MDEIKPKINIPVKYRIRAKILRAIYEFCLLKINSFLNFFSLKKNKRYWGMVYDSVTKQPLDPVIVKLLYADGREIETAVTDIMGRYGFLVEPGKFKIFAKKTNYIFPSKYIVGEKDGIFENIYHGEFFNLNGKLEVVAPNIPMDPLRFDWNQQAKKKLDQSYPFFNLFIKKLAASFFWFFLILNLLSIWAYYPSIPKVYFFSLSFYLLVLVLGKTIPDSRLYGEIEFKNSAKGLDSIFLELHNSQFPEVSFGKTTVHETGKFLLRANPGKYLLTVSNINLNNEKILLGSVNIKIGSEGVFKNTIVIS